MASRILSGLVVAALAASALTTVEVAPASAFTLSSPAHPAFVQEQAQPVYWRRWHRWRHARHCWRGPYGHLHCGW